MNVLMTGAAGKVGRCVAAGLKQRHHIRGFDVVPAPDLEDSIVGDLGDLDALTAAAREMDAVIHLAAAAGARSTWKEVLSANIIGTRNLFQAALRNGVRRVAFASRAGLVSDTPGNDMRTVDLPVRTGHYYSASKAFGENLGYMYAHRFDMEVVCVRIGHFRPHPGHPHHLAHADAVRVFERAILQPGVKFEIVFGVSDSSWPLYDLDHGREAIGYHPQEKSTVRPGHV